MQCDRSNFCGCKGIRSCLKCESEFKIVKETFDKTKFGQTYVYCPLCNKAWPGWDANDYKTHPLHKGDAIDFPGVFIELDFITGDEEKQLIDALDELPWDASQSGRRKQNFGPKCNFKKRKLRLGDFNGFPKSTAFVQERFSQIELLDGYQTIEQCSLEYEASRGASIDAHIDDCWVWGERIVTVNLLTDSVLTLVKYKDSDRKREPNKYNLDYAPHIYKNVASHDDCMVRVPMPSRSLLILYGEARYSWLHFILRDDIADRRVCLAYREFTKPYLEDGELYYTSNDVLTKAKHFW